MEKVSWVRGNCIGRGSFGSVSLAVGKPDGHVFAVKSVDRSSCLGSQIEALESEIKILRSLSPSPSPSPYIVEYLGDDVTCESPYTTSYRNLHLEYMPGGTVADLAKIAGGDVDERILRSYTWCIVSALSYVHGKGIVHCDVKGKNVLVGPTSGTAKLADFGSATESPAVLPRGSPLWMAPEVIRREYQGPESDVWSLGCTVIEMVTGAPAWEDRGGETLCKIGYSDSSPDFPTRLSELGCDFLDKCLRRNRSERWSCDQLLRHPYISSVSPPNTTSFPSPRCVLDSFYSDDDDEEEEIGSTVNCESEENSAIERISKLATNTGVIWESDGWISVRISSFDREEDVSEWTSSEFENLLGTSEEGTEGTWMEFSNLVGTSEEIERANWEYSVEWLECSSGGSSCRYGSEGCDDWAVKNRARVDFTAVVTYLSLFLLYFTAFMCNFLCFMLYTTSIHILFEISICACAQHFSKFQIHRLCLANTRINFLIQRGISSK